MQTHCTPCLWLVFQPVACTSQSHIQFTNIKLILPVNTFPLPPFTGHTCYPCPRLDQLLTSLSPIEAAGTSQSAGISGVSASTEGGRNLIFCAGIEPTTDTVNLVFAVELRETCQSAGVSGVPANTESGRDSIFRASANAALGSALESGKLAGLRPQQFVAGVAHDLGMFIDLIVHGKTVRRSAQVQRSRRCVPVKLFPVSPANGLIPMRSDIVLSVSGF